MMEGGEEDRENAKLRVEVVKDKAEAINLAIQKLMEDEKMKRKKKNEISDVSHDSSFFDEDEEDRLLLSRLLSQLESTTEDNTTQLPAESPTETMTQHSSTDSNTAETKDGIQGDGSREMAATDEILKELKKVKKQNFITHCLLSVMIALTVAWQLSEVSILMKVKKKVSQPFKSVQDLITDITKASPIEPPPLPTLQMPDFPHMDLPGLGLNGGEE